MIERIQFQQIHLYFVDALLQTETNRFYAVQCVRVCGFV